MTHITYNGQSVELTKPFLIQVAAGRIPGASVIRKYGQVTLQSTTGLRDVWEFGSDVVGYGDADYVYPEDGSATITHFSSDNAADTGPFVVQGLLSDGTFKSQTKNLQGTTKVALDFPLWRCFRAFDFQTTTTPVIGEGLSGNVYIYEDGDVTDGVPDDLSTVKSFVGAGQNQTLQAFYTVPSGCNGYLIWSRSALAQKGTASAVVQAWVRPYGYNFRLADTGAVNSTGTSVFQEMNALLNSVPEKTDIMIRADADTNSSVFTARFDILLIDKDYV